MCDALMNNNSEHQVTTPRVFTCKPQLATNTHSIRLLHTKKPRAVLCIRHFVHSYIHSL